MWVLYLYQLSLLCTYDTVVLFLPLELGSNRYKHKEQKLAVISTNRKLSCRVTLTVKLHEVVYYLEILQCTNSYKTLPIVTLQIYTLPLYSSC